MPQTGQNKWFLFEDFMSFDYASLYNLVNKANSVHNLFLVYILYMFRATMIQSSGEITVFMRHLLLVILWRRLPGRQGEVYYEY